MRKLLVLESSCNARKVSIIKRFLNEDKSKLYIYLFASAALSVYNMYVLKKL